MFDPMGTFAIPRMLQDHAAISTFTSLKNLTLPMVSNGPPMSVSEHNAQCLLGLAYPNSFTGRVSLTSIFDQDDAAIAQYFVANFRTVSTRFTAGSIYKIKTSLIQDKEADFIVQSPTGSILFCLEIDGPTHRKEAQQSCDLTKNAVFLAHQIPVYRVTNAEIDAAHSKLPPLNLTTFQQLLLLAKNRWITYMNNPSIKTLQLHRP